MSEDREIGPERSYEKQTFQKLSDAAGAKDDFEAEHNWMSDNAKIQQKHVGMFIQLAEMGELDFYTALSMKYGLKGALHSDTRGLLFRQLPILVALQLVVPTCLLAYQTRRFEFVAQDKEAEFRIVGFILYLYSVWNMYDNSLDECRSLYLELVQAHGLSFRYSWVALLGEAVNALTGFCLALTLFTVFCLTLDPFNLVINCIAINYLGNVDNEFLDKSLELAAMKDFNDLVTEHNLTVSSDSEDDSAVIARASACEACVHVCFSKFLQLVRVVGTLGVGHLLAFMLALGHEKQLCPPISWLQDLPMCIDE